MAGSNSSKVAEYQILHWLLEAGWEIFTPVDDRHGTDFVIRIPGQTDLLAVQVKHKEHNAKNEGLLNNPWAGKEPPFDYLVFYQPEKSRGLILPKEALEKKGKTFVFFKEDTEGYSSGSVRPLYSHFSFDFSAIPHGDRATAFATHFSSIFLELKNGDKPKMAQQVPTATDFLSRAKELWGDSPPGKLLSELVAEGRSP